jgi:hypothetical protein
MFNILLSLLLVSVNQNLWIDKTHQDFQSGKEFYYVMGDDVQNWDEGKLRTWQLGAYFWSPSDGGLRILRRDLDIDDNGYKDVLLARCVEPNNYGLSIFWNYGDSFCSTPTFLSTYPYGSLQTINIADLNCDGFEDITVGAGCWSNTSYIFYGTQHPKIFIKDSVFTEYLDYGAQDIQPIDLNRDGYLDLWIPGNNKVYILYGPNLSYRNPDRILNFCTAGYITNCAFADVNNDAYLDVIIGADHTPFFTIAYGPNFNRIQQLESNDAWELTAADINHDGYLDILAAADLQDYIYWGSAQGYSPYNRTVLYGQSEGNCTIADFNNDDTLDLAIGQIETWEAGNSYIRYGPHYRTNYQILPGGATTVADWNNDGYEDLLFGYCNSFFKLFWNRNGLFNPNDYTFFSCNAFDGVVEDFGNLWDRSNKERYLSRIHPIPQFIPSSANYQTEDTSFQIGIYGYLPNGINLSVMTRSSNDGIKWTNWSLPTGSIPQGAMTGGTVMFLGSYFQYRLIAELDYHHTTAFVIDSVKGFSGSPIMAISEEDNNRIGQLKTNEIRIKGNTAVINLINPGKFVVYDVMGRQIKCVNLNPGNYQMPIADGQGIYFVNLITNSVLEKKKVVVTK